MCDDGFRDKSGKILILCGKSGSGKDAIQRELWKRGFNRVVSTTTRPMREGEVPGREYHFVSRRTFSLLIEWDELIEYRTYTTLVNGKKDVWFYGMRKFQLEESERYVVILDIEGAKSFVDYFGLKNCYVVFVNTSDETREARARYRGSFDETEWKRRLAADEIDFSADKLNGCVDRIIDNNGELSDSVQEIESLFNAVFENA